MEFFWFDVFAGFGLDFRNGWAVSIAFLVLSHLSVLRAALIKSCIITLEWRLYFPITIAPITTMAAAKIFCLACSFSPRKKIPATTAKMVPNCKMGYTKVISPKENAL